MIRVGRDHAVAVWLNHFSALDQQLVVDPQVQFLKHPLHRRRAGNKLELISIADLARGDVEIVLHVFEVQRRIDSRDH